MQIKYLPVSERPLEKAQANGIASLSNSELIALIIRTGTSDESAIELAQRVLCKFENGINDFGNFVPGDITDIKGIGKSKAFALAASVELGKRVSASKREHSATIKGAEDAARLLMEKLRYEKKEHFECILLDTKGHVISMEKGSIGELSSTIVHPREVFTAAVRKSAASVVFGHNHPSGDPEPSGEDIETTRRLIEAGKILGISVLDHIIIGDGTYTSLQSRRLMDSD